MMRLSLPSILTNSSPMRLVLGFIGLIVASAAVVVFIAVFATGTIDRLTRERQSRAIEGELEQLIERVPRDQMSLTSWDEAWDHTYPEFDIDWIDTNIGRYMHRYYKYDDAMVVDPTGTVVFASQGDRRVTPDASLLAPFAEPIEALRARMTLQSDWHELFVSGLFVVNGRIAVASFAPIIPYSAALPPNARPYIHVTMQYLDSTLTSLSSREFGLITADLTKAQDGALASIALYGIDKTLIGYVQWHPDAPGRSLMWQIGPITALMFMVMLLAALRISRAMLKQSDDLKDREASFHMLFEQNPVAMWIVDSQTLKFVAVNDAALTLYEYNREQALRLSAQDLRLPEERSTVEAAIRSFGSHYRTDLPVTRVTATGKHLRVLAIGRRLVYQGRECLVIANIDVSEQERANAELASTRIFLDAVVESIPSMVFVKDANDGRFVLLNNAGEKLLGVKRDDLIGKSDFDLFTPEDAERFQQADRDVVASQTLMTIENEPLATPSGLRSLRTQKIGVPDANGNPRYLLGISEDVTERLEIAQRNQHLSLHDILTDLPNRRSFQIALDEQLCGPDVGFALFLLDLDRFKLINDTMGHLAGDELLRQVATRLGQAKGDHDFLARLGGDEFGLIHCAPTATSVLQLGARLLSTLEMPFDIDGRLVDIGLSMGIVRSPDFGTTADELIRRCDLALYQVKASGKGGYLIFDPAMEQAAERTRLLRNELETAVQNNQLEVVYQPIVNALTGRVVCCEALLRWRHPDLGFISPVEFIPVAEASGMIETIGLWVLNQACAQAQTWPDDIRVAVNLSPKQFTGYGLAAAVLKTLDQTRLRPDRLELEITESVFLSASGENIRLLNELKQLGVRIALDDFGTGYSSLSYLHQFSFDKLKIDKSFISTLSTSDKSLPIIRAVIGMGRSFSASVVAEGVETAEQLEKLAEEGCDQCQGYLFSRPISAADIHRLLRKSRVLLPDALDKPLHKQAG